MSVRYIRCAKYYVCRRLCSLNYISRREIQALYHIFFYKMCVRAYHVIRLEQELKGNWSRYEISLVGKYYDRGTLREAGIFIAGFAIIEGSALIVVNVQLYPHPLDNEETVVTRNAHFSRCAPLIYVARVRKSAPKSTSYILYLLSLIISSISLTMNHATLCCARK